ncbi:hypothetical protein [Geodermatophilus sp. URMC 64]
MAAYDVHAAEVFGRCAPTAGLEPFGQLVEQVMTTEPYASAQRVFYSWTTAPRTTTATRHEVNRRQWRLVAPVGRPVASAAHGFVRFLDGELGPCVP